MVIKLKTLYNQIEVDIKQGLTHIDLSDTLFASTCRLISESTRTRFFSRQVAQYCLLTKVSSLRTEGQNDSSTVPLSPAHFAQATLLVGVIKQVQQSFVCATVWCFKWRSEEPASRERNDFLDA
jgi:hypothetical protein